MSDNHYMDPSLLIKDGPAFQTYLIDNGKLLVASDAIMREFIGEILSANPKPDLVDGFGTILPPMHADTAWHIAQRMNKALMAQMAGDENINLFPFEPDSIAAIANLYGVQSSLPGFCKCLWTDLPPSDNSLTILLKSGKSF